MLGSTAPPEGPGREGEPVVVNGDFADEGVRDLHAAEVDWGDGAVTPGMIDESDGAGSFMASHAYAAGGLYDVLMSLADDDLGGVAASTTIFVTGVGLHDGVMQIVCDTARNVITVHREDRRSLIVHADFLAGKRFRRFDLAAVERIEIYACADDRVNITGSMRDFEIVVLSCTGP